MKHAVFAVCLSALPFAALAQEHPWAPFFETGDVSREGATETAKLKGDVTVTRIFNGDQWEYMAIDLSELGAVACLVGIYIEIDDMVSACPAMADEGQTARLAGVLARSADFYGANAVPAMTAEAFTAGLQDRRAASKTQCPQTAEAEAQVREKIDTWLSPDILARVDASLAVPRLPVSNPCF